MIRLSVALRVFLFVAFALSLGGCKTIGGWFGGDTQEETETLPVEDLYAKAKDYLAEGSPSRAIKYYQRLVARFPFGPYSEQAQLELAYAQFKTGKLEDATAGVDRFIRTYPRHRHIDYAYYLKALINFDRERTIFTRLARMDLSQRDLASPTQSFSDFNDVIRRYPNSRYAADARQRMVFLRNEFARFERNTALYYLRRGAWIAANERATYLLETYPQSEYQNDAVALLGESYARMGNDKLAADARRVLEANDPQHPWLTGKWPHDSRFYNRLNPFAGDL